MTNPYESPKSPSETDEHQRITGRAVGLFVVGFVSSALITLLGTALVTLAPGRLWDRMIGPYAFILVFMSSPAVIGPICSVILWRLTREWKRPFAIGAVTFGVSAFLLIGGCFLAFNV